MRSFRLPAALAMILLAAPAGADLRVDGTRVIQKAADSAPASLRIRNIGTRASLVQAWVDEGDSETPVEKQRAPYLITPPMFRLDEGQTRDLQVRAADTRTLPTDRESLLWINILDVPASSASAMQLDVAMRWRLKLFHRPAGMTGSPSEAPAQLRWRMQPGNDGTSVIQVENPTPYYVSLAELRLDAVHIPLPPDHAQLPPKGSWSIDSGVASALKSSVMHFIWVDDEGVEHTAQAPALP